MVPRPVALGMTLCDYVIVEERTKKVSLIGSFTGLAVAAFPALVAPFSVFAALTDGRGDGTVEVRVTRLETNEQVAAARGSVHFPDPLAEASCRFRFHQCSFPAAGYYQFTLLVDGEWAAQRRIRVYSKEDKS